MRLRRRPDPKRIAELEDALGYDHTDQRVRAACSARWPRGFIPPCVARAVGRRLLASGGTLPARRPVSDDEIPAMLSPGRSTTIRPGETHLEAMERLMEGEDL